MAGRRLTLAELAEKCNVARSCSSCRYKSYCCQYKTWRATVDPFAFIEGIDTQKITFTEKSFKEDLGR